MNRTFAQLRAHARHTVALLSCIAMLSCSSDRQAETRTYVLRQMSPENAADLIRGYAQGDSTLVRISKDSRAITVTAPSARLDQIATVLEQHDRPAPNVRLEFQIIEADGFTSTDSAIADVEAALREVFRFRGYRLLTTAVVTARAPGHFSQTVGGRYAISGDVLPAEADKAISLVVNLQEPGAASSLLLSTSALVPDGQTVVIGSSQPDVSKPTIILVVRTRIQ